MSGVDDAILPFRPASRAGIVQLAAANIACNLHVAGLDRRANRVSYELSLANTAAVAVSGRLYGIDDRASEHVFGMLQVAAFSVGRTCFSVPLEARREIGKRLYVEIIGEGLRLLVEAKVPQDSLREAWPRLIALLSLLAFGTVSATAAYTLMKPSVVALVVPRVAEPGLVTAAYAIQGKATASYVATRSDGRIVASAALRESSGEIALNIPPDSVGRNVTLEVAASGPLGHTARTASFEIDAKPHSAPAVVPLKASVTSLTAHREKYSGDSTVLASYQAAGDSGALRVLDKHGVVVGSAPFGHVGTSRVALHGDKPGESLRAELLVRRGSSRAVASVELPAEVPDTLSPSTPAQTATAAAALAWSEEGKSVALPTDPFYVAGHVVGGSAFNVTIRRSLKAMHLVLQDELGTTLDEHVVAPGENFVKMIAPTSLGVQTYYLTGIFTRASGQEILVRSVRIFPH